MHKANDLRQKRRSDVPLIGALSNGRIGTISGHLARSSDGAATLGSPAPLCKCGCGEQVTGSRRFVSQVHYNRWLSAERYIGKNRHS